MLINKILLITISKYISDIIKDIDPKSNAKIFKIVWKN